MRNISVLADSQNTETGDRVTTLLLHRLPYAILQELATHRLLRVDGTDEPSPAGEINPFTRHVSRSSASSRAIPISKTIERLADDPYVPTFTKHQKGMQGVEEEDPAFQAACEEYWYDAMEKAVVAATALESLGAHKQDVNHLLKPFMRIPVLATATEWGNFFRLRTEKPCHPALREIAIEMEKALVRSTPVPVAPNGWHIPFGDRMPAGLSLKDQLHVAAARAARLSYATHDGEFSVERDLQLAERLLADGHMGPFEHSLRALGGHEHAMIDTANFNGWLTTRAHIEGGLDDF